MLINNKHVVHLQVKTLKVKFIALNKNRKTVNLSCENTSRIKKESCGFNGVFNARGAISYHYSCSFRASVDVFRMFSAFVSTCLRILDNETLQLSSCTKRGSISE